MNLPLLSIIVFAPLLAALVLVFVPSSARSTTRIVAIASSIVSLIGSLIVARHQPGARRRRLGRQRCCS
jgi:NADH:ubiquinone oxidoreductase subunit 4 (subunit M)